jgi:hypothetical protein
MEQESSQIMLMATEQSLAVTVDPSSVYAPPEFHGTVHWIVLTPPTTDDPRGRFA